MSARDELSSAWAVSPEVLHSLLHEAAEHAARERHWDRPERFLPNGMPLVLETGRRDQSLLPEALRVKSGGRH